MTQLSRRTRTCKRVRTHTHTHTHRGRSTVGENRESELWRTSYSLQFTLLAMESGVSQFTCGTWFICLLLKWMGDQISTCFHPNFLPNFLTWLPACLPQPREFWSVSFLLFVSWKQASYTWFSKQHLLSPPHHNFNVQPIEVWKPLQ